MLELRDALREIGQHPTEEELFMMIAQVRTPELLQGPGPPPSHNSWGAGITSSAPVPVRQSGSGVEKSISPGDDAHVIACALALCCSAPLSATAEAPGKGAAARYTGASSYI